MSAMTKVFYWGEADVNKMPVPEYDDQINDTRFEKWRKLIQKVAYGPKSHNGGS